VSTRRSTPPRLASWLLRLRPLGERRRDVTADLLELFQQRLEQHGTSHARRRYYHDVLSVWARLPARIPRRMSPVDGRWGAGSVQDAVHALRLFRRYRASAAIAIVGLGISLGISGSVFSLLDAVVLKGPGISDPANVYRVYRGRDGHRSNTWPIDRFRAVRSAATLISLDGLIEDRVAFEEAPGGGAPERVSVTYVTGTYFTVLGGRAAAGRVLAPTDEEASAPGVVVVSHPLWQRRFGAADAIVGRTIWLNGRPFTIVGVADQQFTGLETFAPGFWAPLSSQDAAGVQTGFAGHQMHVQVVGRISTGASPLQAADQLASLMGGLPSDSSSGDPLIGAQLIPVGRGAERTGDNDGIIALILTIGVVTLSLLLAWVNVANLLLAMAASREREMKLRLALGASRLRLVRQLLTESLLLGAFSGLIGLLITIWAVPVIAGLVQLPPTADVGPNLRLYAFLGMLSALTGVGAGLLPALRGAGAGVIGLRSDGERLAGQRPKRRLRTLLLGGQTAASLLVLALAMLMTRAAIRAAVVDPGFDADRLINVSAVFSRSKAGEADVAAYWDTARERLRGLPGIERTAVILFPPYSGGMTAQSTRRNGQRHTVFRNHATPAAFETIGLRLLRGRIYSDQEERMQAPVAVISQTLARDYWPGEDPIGHSLDRLHEDMAGIRVVGIVSDAYTARLREYQAAAVYQPLRPGAIVPPQLVIRATRPAETVRAVTDVLRAISPEVRPTATLAADGLAAERREPATIALLAAIAAAVAVALSLVGLVGATLQHVRQRAQEIGLRLAIGASSGSVLRLLLRESLRPVAIGLTAGVIVAELAGAAIGSVIFGVSPTDSASLAASLGLLATAAVVAVIVPTYQASRTDPATVLREP
jgi:predicted permease